MPERGPHAWPQRRREWRVLFLALIVFVVALGCAIALVWLHIANPTPRILASVALTIVLGSLLAWLFKAAVEPLRVLASVIEAYRHGDYSIRSNRQFPGSAMNDLVLEVNRLGDSLREQRLRAMEATALLDKLISAIDIAVLAFDGEGRLRLCNGAALQLLERDAAFAIGRNVTELGVSDLLGAEEPTRVVTSICGRSGRWQATHGTFRDAGLSQHLLIVSDLRRVLREEERAAWQRLVRVIGHEINNSLTPIKSLAESLYTMLDASLAAGELRNDALPALRVVAERSTSLQRFLAQYGRLNRMPMPQRKWVHVAPLVRRVAALEPEHGIDVVAEDELQAYLDETQLEQALINLVRNAIEAQGDVGGRITITARSRNATLQLIVMDQGSSLVNADNLFVPFFTTKAGGSGIGLVLSRQIAEAHGGTLSLVNRSDGRGAVATLELPNALRSGARPSP
jgi:two-component system, NtrC family, nitrogen regulation sensor histidine kinase NtrY